MNRSALVALAALLVACSGPGAPAPAPTAAAPLEAAPVEPAPVVLLPPCTATAVTALPGHGLPSTIDGVPVVPSSAGVHLVAIDAGATDADREHAAAAMAALSAASGWDVRLAAPGELHNVRLVFERDGAPSAACAGTAEGRCWFGNGGCTDEDPEVLQSGAGPVRRYREWTATINADNVYEWNRRAWSTRAVMAAIAHELAHTLGLSHASDGLIAPFMPWDVLLGEIWLDADSLAMLEAFELRAAP